MVRRGAETQRLSVNVFVGSTPNRGERLFHFHFLSFTRAKSGERSVLTLGSHGSFDSICLNCYDKASILLR